MNGIHDVSIADEGRISDLFALRLHDLGRCGTEQKVTERLLPEAGRVEGPAVIETNLQVSSKPHKNFPLGVVCEALFKVSGNVLMFCCSYFYTVSIIQAQLAGYLG